ncbi:hypothetical protein [Pyxidicoccus trucidator]|uniref:hypothetical protein n=1 Tax=Pyxidicoccus trucidator TaxID=2709662 RepID=UPI0013D9E9E6|nr:hypothetical protein [Pyxidicoccus trucidator]
MSRLKKSAFTLALALAAVGCSDPVDKAAKARIFSPEDPPKVVASAKQKLPPEDVASNPQVARRILGMDAAEVTERLGPHRFQSTVSYEWTSAEANPVKLTESRTFRAGPGGVSGDFHGVLENSRDQGLEVMRVGGQVFARNRYGPFRQRLRDRGMAERTRTELTGAIRDFDSLFQGRIKLTPDGTVSHEGRVAWRYTVTLGPVSEGTASRPLPAPFEPKGTDESTRRRASFFAHRVPRSLDGEVLVDSTTSVVLKARLDGRMGVPSEKTPEAAELRMTLESALTEVGQDPKLQPPEDFLPDADKPQGIADALDAFGIERKKPEDADKTKPATDAPPEPEDEEGT